MQPGKVFKRSLIALAIVSVFLIGLSYFCQRQQRDGLAIKFVGLTNYPGMRQPTALFAVTNLVGPAVNVQYLVEVKTAGWPVYGPDMQASWRSGILAPHEVTTWAIGVPEYGWAWRVRVVYWEGPTKWDTLRSSLAASLHKHRLHWVARFIWRGKARSIFLLPEMTTTNHFSAANRVIH